MKLFTKAQYEQLIKNGKAQDGTKGFKPVVKWFTPDANCMWLISEIDPDNSDVAFGLCDLGLGFPELGSVYIPEIQGIKGQLGLSVERDLRFEGEFPLAIYAEIARSKQRIVTSKSIIEAHLNENKRFDEIDLQRQLDSFVNREVIANISMLVMEMAKRSSGDYEEYASLFFANDDDGEPCEIYEHWLISPWLSIKLEEQGEAIDSNYFGLSVWGRSTTGQRISMDSVIREIYQEYIANK